MNFKFLLIFGIALFSNILGISKNMRIATNAIKSSNYNYFYSSLKNYKLNKKN